MNDLFHRANLQRVLDRYFQPFHRNRLHAEIDGTSADRADDRFNAALRRLNDHRHRGLIFGKRAQHTHAVNTWHHQVQNNQIDRRA